MMAHSHHTAKRNTVSANQQANDLATHADLSSLASPTRRSIPISTR